MAGVPESTALLAGGVSVATTRSSGYIGQSGWTSIVVPLSRVQRRKIRNPGFLSRMSYDAEKATAAAAFSEESVRRGFIKKVRYLRKEFHSTYMCLLVLSGLFHSLCSTPAYLWHCGALQPKLWSSKPIPGEILRPSERDQWPSAQHCILGSLCCLCNYWPGHHPCYGNHEQESPIPGISGNTGLQFPSRKSGMEFSTPIPVPEKGNGIFITAPVPENWEWN